MSSCEKVTFPGDNLAKRLWRGSGAEDAVEAVFRLLRALGAKLHAEGFDGSGVGPAQALCQHTGAAFGPRATGPTGGPPLRSPFRSRRTYEHLLRQVWGADAGGEVRPMRTVIRSLRRKLEDDADNPTYIFTEHSVGYWMPRGEGTEPEGS